MATDVKYVYTFAEGSREASALLGGKGANLAEMTNLGLPVPPGFTITTLGLYPVAMAVTRSGPASILATEIMLTSGVAGEGCILL